VGALALNGRDLIGMGLRPGPNFGHILDDLLDYVLADPARNRPELLASRVQEFVENADG
jgi:tRNA nucleotidyltransferase (CCA-adding enzyme)